MADFLAIDPPLAEEIEGFDLTTITPVEGHGLGFDGTNWVPLFIPFQLSCGRNQATVNTQWLRDANGTPFNLAPFIAPFDIKLVGITCSVNVSGTADFEVFTGANARVAAPTNGLEVAQLSLSATVSASSILNIDIAAGTELGVYVRVPGVALEYARATLFIVRRA